MGIKFGKWNDTLESAECAVKKAGQSISLAVVLAGVACVIATVALVLALNR